MSQHYLKYHFKSLICTNKNAVSEDESNGNNGKDIDTDVINGNSTGRKISNNYNNNNNNNIHHNASTPLSIIRITENPLN